jgi:hypothetical protein
MSIQRIGVDGRALPPVPQVVLAWCHNGDVRGDWAECQTELRLVDALTRRLMDVTKRPIIEKGLYIHRNRNQAVKHFLNERTEPWLMFIDTDMLFAPAQFYALYEEAVRGGIGIHAGLYYGIYVSEGIGNGQNEVKAAHGGGMISSTWLRKREGYVETIAERRLEVRDDLDACGMGFTLIHRRVLEALAAEMPNHSNAWFGHDEETDPRTGDIDGIGEDMTFCTRAKKLGFKIFGHDTVALGHDKHVIITWEYHDHEQQRMRGVVNGQSDSRKAG